jgi:hypothetical protein
MYIPTYLGRQGNTTIEISPPLPQAVCLWRGSTRGRLSPPSIMTKKAVHENVDLGQTRSSDMKRKSFAAQQQTIQTLRNLIEYKELACSFTLKVDLFDLILYCSSTC